MKLTKRDFQSFSPAIILVGGASGVGKTSLIDKLINKFPNEFCRPISFTSRTPRDVNDSSEYIFKSKNEMLSMDKNGELLNLDEVYGDYYGIHKNSLNTLDSNNMFLIKEVHPLNHNKIKSQAPFAITVLYASEYELGKNHNRSKTDLDYYSSVNHDEFDIVLFREHFDGPESAAISLRYYVKALAYTHTLFPDPISIDKTNAEGYTLAAPEFLDDSRVTTRNFHELSIPYFELILEQIKENNREPKRCLEVGPGRGWFYSTFRPRSFQYTGVEIAPAMVEYLSDNNQYHCSTVRRLPFSECYFSFIVCSLSDPYFYPLALCEIRRVLNVGGTVVFTAPSRHWANGLRAEHERDKTRFVLKGGGYADVYSFTYTAEEIRDLLELCGFSSISCTEVGGGELQNTDISDAIARSADNLDIPLELLPIINFITASRDK